MTDINNAKRIVLETVTRLAGPNHSFVAIRDVRRECSELETWQVNGCLVLLQQQHDIYFFCHDYPASLSEFQRSECLIVNGTVFNGCGIRR